jgi:ATP-dependent phosphoenolpyruvate carboxykinase
VWVKKTDCYLQNGEYTITKSNSVASILPYGLHHKNMMSQFFKTADEAKEKFNEIIKLSGAGK